FAVADHADRMPRPEFIRELAALHISRKGSKLALGFRLEDIDVHRRSLAPCVLISRRAFRVAPRVSAAAGCFAIQQFNNAMSFQARADSANAPAFNECGMPSMPPPSVAGGSARISRLSGPGSDPQNPDSGANIGSSRGDHLGNSKSTAFGQASTSS